MTESEKYRLDTLEATQLAMAVVLKTLIQRAGPSMREPLKLNFELLISAVLNEPLADRKCQQLQELAESYLELTSPPI
jgi:hypothetical protein